MSMVKGWSKELVLGRDQCRAVDGYAIEQLGIPGVVLMENAGRNAADLIERWLRRRAGSRRSSEGRVGILCGKGNNGGDGFVVARHLAQRGHQVSVDLTAEASSLTGDAAVNCAIAEKMGVPIYPLFDGESLAAAARRWKRCQVMVDALLGTGFTGEVREPLAAVISRVNALGGPLIVAIDVPSGLDADTGTVGTVAVKADRTITFLAKKRGFLGVSARPYLGQIYVVDIGAPTGLILTRLGITGG